METAERRMAILKLLCRRRYKTIANLAVEFGVSERTVRRDIETLSLREPIYTQTERYAGLFSDIYGSFISFGSGNEGVFGIKIFGHFCVKIKGFCHILRFNIVVIIKGKLSMSFTA